MRLISYVVPRDIQSIVKIIRWTYIAERNVLVGRNKALDVRIWRTAESILTWGQGVSKIATTNGRAGHVLQAGPEAAVIETVGWYTTKITTTSGIAWYVTICHTLSAGCGGQDGYVDCERRQRESHIEYSQ